MAIEVKETSLDFSEIHDRMQWYVDKEILPCCNTLILQGTDVVDELITQEHRRPAIRQFSHRRIAGHR